MTLSAFESLFAPSWERPGTAQSVPESTPEVRHRSRAPSPAPITLQVPALSHRRQFLDRILQSRRERRSTTFNAYNPLVTRPGRRSYRPGTPWEQGFINSLARVNEHESDVWSQAFIGPPNVSWGEIENEGDASSAQINDESFSFPLEDDDTYAALTQENTDRNLGIDFIEDILRREQIPSSSYSIEPAESHVPDLTSHSDVSNTASSSTSSEATPDPEGENMNWSVIDQETDAATGILPPNPTISSVETMFNAMAGIFGDEFYTSLDGAPTPVGMEDAESEEEGIDEDVLFEDDLMVEPEFGVLDGEESTDMEIPMTDSDDERR